MLLHGLSLVVVSGGYAQAAVCGLLIVKASLAVVLGLQGTQAQQLWCMSLVAPWQVGSYQIQDQTHVSCIGRQILYHCTTTEVP